MNTGTLTMSFDADVDPDPRLHEFVDKAKFASAAEEWSSRLKIVNAFEDEHLLGDNAPVDKLARHKKMVERLMFWGQIFATVTAHPDFDDSETTGMIFATQQALRDSLRMFHHPNPMSSEKAAKILQEVFPES